MSLMIDWHVNDTLLLWSHSAWMLGKSVKLPCNQYLSANFFHIRYRQSTMSYHVRISGHSIWWVLYMNTWVYAYMCICMFICKCVSIHICVYLYVCMCIYVYTVCVYVHTCACVSVNLCMQICICVFIMLLQDITTLFYQDLKLQFYHMQSRQNPHCTTLRWFLLFWVQFNYPRAKKEENKISDRITGNIK